MTKQGLNKWGLADKQRRLANKQSNRKLAIALSNITKREQAAKKAFRKLQADLINRFPCRAELVTDVETDRMGEYTTYVELRVSLFIGSDMADMKAYLKGNQISYVDDLRCLVISNPNPFVDA